ncbi:NF-X1-type zinc finger protein NFXL1 [Lycorma delicatula]|uniref:NF-X1-type zinc finger protein NFXL1 n=1 Tax=Lycorma delicatula TaxID=130591 RepID=UPI003F5149E3
MSGRGSNRNTNPWNRGGSRGGGRGSGHGNYSQTTTTDNKAVKSNNTNNRSGDQKKNVAEQKFLEAHTRLQASVKKHLKNGDYESSEEEEELESETILGSVLKSYSHFGGETYDLGRTQKFLEDAFQSGAAICLICIATVKRPDAIWSCIECFCFFHVQCIQRWAKDSIAHQKQGLEDRQINKSIDKLYWACPKCRKDYDSAEIPYRYYCFCGKTEDPKFHPWLVPHSCGETCNRELQPKCGHNCLLLCHPGPCPPCPKTVKSKCYCGRSNPQPQRCSNKFWSCGQSCGRKLACGRHLCDNVCHGGDCPSCPERSTQSCMCGNKTVIRECAEPQWHCDKVCDKKLDCGNHRCKEVCHKGDCGPCPLSLQRTCPCGKSLYLLPCIEETPTCGDTCGKTLECGQHKCFQRCHHNKCGPCLERIVKFCRCGLHSKEVPCTKEYLCETKCKRIRDCNYHPCNRKCCDGSCPPCEKPCSKTLQCGNHKCQSVCHRGPCYPCPRTVQVSCRCGLTTIVVPCGRGVRSRPPRCNKQCKIPPDCHHPSRQPHNCHFGTCPSCKQICGIKQDPCGHECKQTCHSAITDPNEGIKPKGIWDKGVPQSVFKSKPCDPCPEPIQVTCLGNHERYDLPCHRAFSTSCERPCGRALSCGNHSCQLKCHIVLGAEDDNVAGENCEPCERGCELPRPPGCTHKCPHACHLAPCPPCMTMLRLRCHCSLNQLFVRCGEFNSASTDKQIEMLSCNNQCPKNLPCGHRCTSTCHTNDCPNPEGCRQKVKLTCPCHRIKKDFRCNVVRAGEAVIKCDEICKAKAEEERQKKILLQKQQQELEEQKNKEEFEKFQKKFQGRKKHRERRTIDDSEKNSFFIRNWPWFAASGSIGLAVIILYWL